MENLVELFKRVVPSPDWCMVIITLVYAVTTIGIMVANHNSAKIAKKQLKEQEEEAAKAEKHHQEVMALQRNEARVAQMPYFYLSNDVTFGVRNGKLTLRISLENCGNGPAVQIKLLTKIILGEDVPIVYQNEINKVTYIQTDELNRVFSKVGSSIEFEMIRDFEDADKVIQDKVVFEIEFMDMLGNMYRQSFKFEYRWSGVEKSEGQLGFIYCNQPQLQ